MEDYATIPATREFSKETPFQFRYKIAMNIIVFAVTPLVVLSLLLVIGICLALDKGPPIVAITGFAFYLTCLQLVGFIWTTILKRSLNPWAYEVQVDPGARQDIAGTVGKAISQIEHGGAKVFSSKNNGLHTVVVYMPNDHNSRSAGTVLETLFRANGIGARSLWAVPFQASMIPMPTYRAA